MFYWGKECLCWLRGQSIVFVLFSSGILFPRDSNNGRCLRDGRGGRTEHAIPGHWAWPIRLFFCSWCHCNWSCIQDELYCLISAVLSHLRNSPREACRFCYVSEICPCNPIHKSEIAVVTYVLLSSLLMLRRIHFAKWFPLGNFPWVQKHWWC